MTTRDASEGKLRVGVLFGGRSTEHEISLSSARNVVKALDPERFEAVLIGIAKDGSWHLAESARLLGAVTPVLDATSPQMTLAPSAFAGSGQLAVTAGPTLAGIDVFFPVLHGPLGEDGTVQGLIELLDVPFVGSGVLGSALGMDKDVTKRLLRDAGIPVAPFEVVRSSEFARDPEGVVKRALELGLPLFTKPANAGSSVGVRKVTRREDVRAALAHAFEFDRKVLVEAGIVGREIECAVLGNDEPRASIPGEVVVRHADGFYSYEAKYLDEAGAVLELPARLSDADIERVQALALRTFTALECEGLARVDCFLTPEGDLLVNEINTLPGFTPISMYPKLWELSGIGARELVTRLVELAIERHAQKRALRTNFQPT